MIDSGDYNEEKVVFAANINAQNTEATATSAQAIPHRDSSKNQPSMNNVLSNDPDNPYYIPTGEPVVKPAEVQPREIKATEVKHTHVEQVSAQPGEIKVGKPVLKKEIIKSNNNKDQYNNSSCRNCFIL